MDPLADGVKTQGHGLGKDSVVMITSLTAPTALRTPINTPLGPGWERLGRRFLRPQSLASWGFLGLLGASWGADLLNGQGLFH